MKLNSWAFRFLGLRYYATMGIPLMQQLMMWFRKVPVRRAKRCLAMAEAASLNVSLRDIECHFLLQRDPERLVEAMIVAKGKGIPVTWTQLSTIDLTNRDVMKVLSDCMQVHIHSFDTYRADGETAISGICGDGSRHSAVCTIQYRVTPNAVFGTNLNALQERLATRISSQIHEAENTLSLRMNKSRYEAELLSLASNRADVVVLNVALKYIHLHD